MKNCERKWWSWIKIVVGVSFIVLAFSKLIYAGIREEGIYWKISNSSTSFCINKENGGFHHLKVLGNVISGKGGIYFIDGKTGAAIKEGKAHDFKTENNALIFRWGPEISSELEVLNRIEVFPSYISYKIKLSNKSSSQKWLQARVEFMFSAKKDFSYWDGHTDHKVVTKSIARDSIRGTFPLACIYDQFGLAIGIEPHQILSFLESGVEKGEKNKAFYYGTKIVIDPKDEETIEFIIYGFLPRYGWKDAVQIYYDSFPDIFSPLPDIDPRINGISAGCPIAKDIPQKFYARDLIRKLRGKWQWAYGWIARGGDLAMTKELTENWYVSKKGALWKDIGFEGCHTVEEFKQRRKKRAKALRELGLCPMAHLVYSCEEELAKERYSDSFYEGPGIKRLDPWVHNNQAHRVMYAYGNSYGKVFLSDLEKLIEQFDIGGIAADMGGSDTKHYGGGVNNSPGRAFDDKGVYVTMETCLAKIFDKIHSLKKGSYRMGVVKNSDGTSTYMSIFRTDAAIYEHPPYYNLYGEDPMHLRLLLGRKTLNWWFKYLLEKFVDWRALSKEDLLDAYRGARDYVLLYCLYTGSVATPFFSSGVPRIIKYLPIMEELALTGWEPVPAMKADARLWLARYGKGVGSFLTLGNPTFTDIRTKVKIDNIYLGEMDYAFMGYGGKRVISLIKEGETHTELEIKARSPVVLRTILGIRNGKGLRVEAKGKFPLGKEGNIRIEIDSPRSCSTLMRAWVPKKTTLTSIKLNGKPLSYQKNTGGIEFEAGLKSGENKIEINFQPKIRVLTSYEKIKDYPFLNEAGEPNCCVMVGDASKKEMRIINFIVDYFYKMDLPNPPIRNPLPIIREVPAGYKGNLIIVGTPESNSLIKQFFTDFKEVEGIITIDENRLIIGASKLSTLKEVIFALLEILDEKYPHFGHFGGRTFRELKKEIYQKAGLDREVLK